MRPAARISANGVDITTKLIDPRSQRAILASLTITDEAGIKSDTLELEIDNRPGLDGAVFAVPPIGSELEVWLGYEPAPLRMGRFRVDDWTKSGPPSVIRISAKSAELTTAIKSPKRRSWHDTTVGSIVATIAGEHGLGVAISAELKTRPIEHIDQQTESDIGFLTRLASRQGATFKVADGKVVFAAKGSREYPTGGDKPEVVIRPADVSTWSVTESERGGFRSVVCEWHDHQAGKRKSVAAGTGEPVHRHRHVYRTEADAKAAAEARLGDLKRGRREAQFTGVGNPTLFAEGVARLEGFDPDCDGTFFVKSVTHSLNAGGYTTSVTLETAAEEE